ncbi:hypothetical protein N7532_003434 [Penicillium argentinense]|uniref:Cyclin n=1 Tax=Penicillium argentinense TaxID=1131581 RepID=A0A9W9FN07_9EURO|nr:uncharacterized protein N7532_003434 [Penicillium argentinense]KAJ5102905.1 hypothetical protein N7532_003434 [Penicillium argentinense]
MAATMTQIVCPAEGPGSPGPLLKLGSPVKDAGSTHSHSRLNTAAGVFDISPEIALQQLCNNVEKLNSLFASESATTDSNFSCATPVGSETGAEEELAVKGVGLHCGNGEDHSERTKEETFQMTMLSRKFLSKKVPPIALKDYLLRLHRYCPMSTAVFLAASAYITRMALAEKILRVVPKNMHRLVLAGLLVATKALEDLSYPHSRVAKVGGVSEHELSKLEISFCFLADFDLRVDAQMLMNEVDMDSLPISPPPEPSHG